MIVSIPLEIVQLEESGRHILIHSYIGRKKVYLLIDTGASNTVFDNLFYTESYEGILRQCNQVAGINAQNISNKTGVIKTLRIGDLRLKNFETVFIDLSDINVLYRKYSKRNIAGLLGSDFLLKYKAVISYLNLTMELTLPD